MRVVCGIALGAHALPLGAIIPNLLEILAGVLLIAGLWTPIAGSLVAIWELWNLFSRQAEFVFSPANGCVVPERIGRPAEPPL